MNKELSDIFSRLNKLNGISCYTDSLSDREKQLLKDAHYMFNKLCGLIRDIEETIDCWNQRYPCYDNHDHDVLSTKIDCADDLRDILNEIGLNDVSE